MTEQQLKEMYEIITETWKVAKKYYATKQTDDDLWVSIDKELNDIYAKHNNSEFCRQIGMAVMEAIDNTSKGKSL